MERRGDEGPGRPSLDVTKDQIEFLRSMHFSSEKIAQLLQVSVSTLQRRRRAFGIDDHLEHYSDISDHDLDAIYKELTAADGNLSGGFLTPNIGRRRFMGALRSRGIRVQRWRVSQCLRRVDPIGTALAQLWHFDSSHKRIRWKLIAIFHVTSRALLGIVFREPVVGKKRDTVSN